MSFKSGFVSIVGRPNVGKSTLLNQILKTKLAIMSDVAQTTRNTIQGIYTDNEAQIIFMDTPGIHKPQDGLGNFMNTTALNSIYGVDMVLFIAPANETIGRGDRFIIERLKEADGPVFLLLNKCDLVSKDEVIKKLTEWKELFDFKEIIPISALEDQNVDTLISTIKTYLNEGMMYYPKDQMTDHPERFVMAEFIREKILYFTREEVPHSVAIVVERMAELDVNQHNIREAIRNAILYAVSAERFQGHIVVDRGVDAVFGQDVIQRHQCALLCVGDEILVIQFKNIGSLAAGNLRRHLRKVVVIAIGLQVDGDIGVFFHIVVNHLLQILLVVSGPGVLCKRDCHRLIRSLRCCRAFRRSCIRRACHGTCRRGCRTTGTECKHCGHRACHVRNRLFHCFSSLYK